MSNLRQRLKQSRTFLYALLIVFAVWVASNMSERRNYREEYRIVYSGMDTTQYAVLQCDSIVTMEINCNGFYALRRSIHKASPIQINVGKKLARIDGDEKSLTLDIAELSEVIKKQIDLRGVRDIKPIGSKLHIRLVRRESKAFVPDIKNVEFQFEGMKGLCGEPVVTPDTIWLYGSRKSLDKIKSVNAIPQTIKGINGSGEFKVKLDSEWEKYPDLRISSRTVTVYLPVESFVEKKITRPVTFSSEQDVQKVRLYPSEVTVSFLVPKKDYASTDENAFEVTVKNDDNSSSFLYPVVSRFPSNVRVTSVEPSQVQYVVIK